jgi:NAD(P)-dependent dehydrogenase (short-subunit alcohol dehydrogenase family)
LSVETHAARHALARATDTVAEATVAPSFSRIGIGLRRRLEEWGDPPPMKGRTALVTGATSGIGRASAEELARHGAEVIVHGRDAARGAAVVDAITAGGGKARFIAADLGDLGQLDHLAEQAGPVDVLVNNAGFSWFGPTADLDAATFDRLFAANVRAPYFLVAALAPKMAARGSGSIISLSSMAAQIGLAGGAAYSATKATLAAMTRSWAAEFSPAGVRVNAVAAGPVLTAGAAPERIEALGDTTLLSRAAQPAEIAEVIAFLASPKASYITGAVLAADGGRTAI